MEQINVRQAKQSELKALLNFEQEIVEFERSYDPTLKTEHFHYYDIKALIESDDAEVVVATINEVLVGSGYAQKQKAKNYLDHEYFSHLGFMYVHPDHRGKGINSMIIDVLKEWSKSKKLFEMRLNVYDENLGAIRAYQKAGLERHLINMRIRIS